MAAVWKKGKAKEAHETPTQRHFSWLPQGWHTAVLSSPPACPHLALWRREWAVPPRLALVCRRRGVAMGK